MENEEPPKSISMKSALVVVVSLHAVALFGLIYFSSVKSSQAESDKKFLKDVYAGVEQIPSPSPSPTPVPVPIDKMPEKQSWPTENLKPELKTWPNTKKAIPVNQKDSHYTKEYTIKKGDTFNGIVRKYKLNPDKLKQLNNIKNENSIKVGQKLKLM